MTIFEVRTREYQRFLLRCAETVQQGGEVLALELARSDPDYHTIKRSLAAINHDLGVLERAFARFQQARALDQ